MTRRRTVRPRPLAGTTVDEWADVLVVGYGCAGATAAWEAATAGASVLVLERASGPGGTSALSGGEVYLGGGTDLQKASGVEDDAASMAAFLRLALGPAVDEEKLQAYCAGSPEHYRWLADRGVPFTPGVYDEPSWMPPTRDGLMWLGEKTWPFTEVATPAPRGHRPSTGHFGGWLLMDKLTAAAAEAGAEIRSDCLAERLLVDDTGRVCGVVTRQFGEERVFGARRAVILTTGGFIDDDEMLAQHVPQLLGKDKISCGGEDGSGIRMAQAVGADIRHMGTGQVGISAVPAFMARGIVVSQQGMRFINEDTYPGRIGQAALFQHDLRCWVILDEKGYEQVPLDDRWGVQPQHVAETVAELEELTGIAPGALAATLVTYNEHAAHGEDPVFHKDIRWLRPLEPPFAAFDPRRTFRMPGDPPVGGGASVFTLGGLATDVDGHVLDLDGTPIPGLLAAGRATSGLAAFGYISGTSIGDGTFFGRRAGQTAAEVPVVGTSPAPDLLALSTSSRETSSGGGTP